MAEPTKDSLRGLDGIYRFAGGLRGPGELDLDRPIALVHDVARTAAVESGVYLDLALTEITGGAGGNNRQSLLRGSIYTTSVGGAQAEELTRNAGLSPGNSDVWLLSSPELQVDSGISDLSAVVCGVTNWPNSSGRTRTILVASGAWVSAQVQAGDGTPIKLGSTGTSPRSGPSYPIRIGGIFQNVLDDGTGAVTLESIWRVAIVPRGVVPPAGG